MGPDELQRVALQFRWRYALLNWGHDPLLD